MNESKEALPRVLVVVVTHNGREWLPYCLEAISQQNYPSLDVIVVDAASQTRTAPIVEKLLPDAEFARLDQNVGFGAAANYALESATNAPGADHYLFVHDDVVLEPTCVSNMVAAAVETEAGVVGGKGLSWEQPNLLLEVGMSADQLGFPLSGLELGEIDQGQHDDRREVLFVTNACILVSRAVIERVGSWDGAYFAFGEDLDFCLRGRLAGFRVVFEPGARFKHLVALVSGRRATEGESIRFYTRRNRLRTITKTAAAYRLWAVLLLYGVVMAAEIVLLASLRRFDETRAYPKALWSFVRSIPDVLRRRRAVQKRRAVPDRRIRRLMVSDLHRARVFAERRLREWEVGTLRFRERTFALFHPAAMRAALLVWLRRPATLGVAGVVVLLAIAARDMLFGGPLAAGGIWPFPAPNRALLTDYFASWRDVGLGTSSATPPALPLVWMAGVLSFNSPGFAQLLLIVALVASGFVGMYRLVSRRTARITAKVVALAIYALGPVSELMVSRAELSSLVLFAGLPYALDVGLRMLGPTPSEDGDRAPTPTTVDEMVQDSARLSLIAVVIVALAPSAYLALLFLWLVAALHSYAVAWDRRDLLTRAGWLGRSLGGTLILLLPWTIEALRPRGAILGPIFSGNGGGTTYSPLWSGLGFTDLLLLRPRGGALAAVGVGAIVLGALAMSTASRRRESRLLVTVLVVFAAGGGFVAKGWLPAPVASATMWMMVPLAVVSVLAGHLAAGVAEELPRHALGLRHAVAFSILGTMLVGIGWGWGGRLLAWERPTSTLAGPTGERSMAINSFFVSTAESTGEFRVLWLGPTWADPIRSGLRRMDGTTYFVTGSEGLTMRDLYEPPPSEGERALDRVVAGMSDEGLDHAGHLLAPMGIRYVVADVADEALMSSMRRQRDFKLEQSEIAVFRNLRWVPRAVLAPPGLAEIATAKAFDSRALMLADWEGGRQIPATSQSSFEGTVPRTRHAAILLGDNRNDAWHASVGGRSLEVERAFGWASRFDLPKDARGEVKIRFASRWPRFVWLGIQGLMLGMAIAMARLRGSRTAPV